MSTDLQAMTFARQKGSEPAWHRMGAEVDAHGSIEDWRDAAGLNWDVNESLVTFRDGEDSFDFPGRKVLYRSDNRKPLSVVSTTYRTVQPATVLEFFRDMVATQGFEIETAGSFQGGKRIWTLARLNQEAEVGANDLVRGMLLLATSYDASMATTARWTTVRVVCENTLAMAVNRGGDAVRIRHDAAFDAISVKAQLGVGVSKFQQFMDEARNLARRPVNRSFVDGFLAQLFPPMPATENRPQVEHYASRKVRELFDGAGLGADLPASSGTRWGLVNAVTEFVDWHARGRSDDSKGESSLFGGGADIKVRALQLAMA